uniref:Uncharacterized protein n=1 Tax=Sipha flava TaxID=143950 RepID=A0A2S2QC99_9HEMI
MDAAAVVDRFDPSRRASGSNRCRSPSILERTTAKLLETERKTGETAAERTTRDRRKTVGVTLYTTRRDAFDSETEEKNTCIQRERENKCARSSSTSGSHVFYWT